MSRADDVSFNEVADEIAADKAYKAHIRGEQKKLIEEQPEAFAAGQAFVRDWVDPVKGLLEPAGSYGFMAAVRLLYLDAGHESARYTLPGALKAFTLGVNQAYQERLRG